MRFCLISFLLVACPALSQTVVELQQRLDKYNDATTPEYVSVHLDREMYFAGDQIWYAIYLNNTPRSASSLSAVVYVELRDALDSVVVRQKIKCREGMGHGDLRLSNRLRTGNYRLLAYTLWMRNKQAELYQTTVPVVNLDLPIVINSPPETSTSNDAGLRVTSDSPGHYFVKAPANGKLVIYDREEILLLVEVAKEQDVKFSCNDRDHDAVTFALLEESGNIKHLKEVGCQHTVKLDIDAGRTEVKPRQKFDVSLLLTDKYGDPLTGNLSVSVRSVGPEWPQLSQKPGGSWLTTAKLSEDGSRKEMFVYPAHENTLKPVHEPPRPPVPFDIKIDSLRASYLEEIGTNTNIVRAFGAQLYFERESGYNIPFNFSYQTKDYLSLPTVQDFIRELIPQLRIRKTGGERRLFLRYVTENSLVYYFKEPALVLVDGFVLTDVEDFLKMPLDDIDRIDLTWGMREINSMGVFSLADNGIVAVHSKSRNLKKEGLEIWKEYHHPHIFRAASPANNGDEVPVLGEPAYWNPDVPINGKAKVEINAPDRDGEMIVEVQGLSSTGYRVSGRVKVTVTLDRN